MDKELEAIKNIVNSLEALDSNAKERVLFYVLKRLGMTESLLTKEMPFSEEKNEIRSTVESLEISTEKTINDIRSLKENKKPKSAIEMAVLVAYYLTEMAPKNERKNTIKSEDITKYFKQAGFQLPTGNPVYALRNAKNSGYLDFTGKTGTYKLNPVGYNLVAFKLPEDVIRKKSRKAKKRRKKVKKKLKKIR